MINVVPSRYGGARVVTVPRGPGLAALLAPALRPLRQAMQEAKASPVVAWLRRMAAAWPVRLLWWLLVRIVVGVACVAAILGVAHLTMHFLISAYANIAPYTGVN